MTNTQDSRRQFIEEVAGTADRHRQRSFEYEGKAIEFANNAFRALTYLNGGALVAIPTAVALFKADIAQARLYLTCAAALFVLGLLLVVLAQAAAFFTMARRSEAETNYEFEQDLIANLRHYIKDPEAREKATADARAYNKAAVDKISGSNVWRLAALIFFWTSAIAFVAGCWFRARAILG